MSATDANPIGLTIGDAVRHRDTGEVGIIVWMRSSDDGAADTYVAFFGDSFPVDDPKEKPYVLRYYSTSLEKISRPNQGEQDVDLNT